MDNLSISFFLGIIQGLSEFLPISSSGHLILGPWIFGFPDPGLSFDVALHVGTLLAVVSYFFQDWIDIFRAFFGKRISPLHPEYNQHFLPFLAVATVPGVMVGFFLDTLAEQALRNPLLIASTLFLGGGLLFWADRFFAERENLLTLNVKKSLLIGLAQALAIFPGVSRSGITMTVARMLGFNRVAAARFSFLLSTPIIFGAAVLKFPALLSQAGSLSFWVGVLASAVSGYLAIRFLLHFLIRFGFALFFWYRTALALLILSLFFFRM